MNLAPAIKTSALAPAPAPPAKRRGVRWWRWLLPMLVILGLCGYLLGGKLPGGDAADLQHYQTAPVSGFQTFVSTYTFGFSAAIEIFFGFYPAQKAARLDPIDALRYE